MERQRRIAAARVDELRDAHMERLPSWAWRLRDTVDCGSALKAVALSHEFQCRVRAWQLRARIYTSGVPRLALIADGWPD